MGEKQAHEPASIPSVTPVIEATSYGGLFGLVAAVGAAIAAWVFLRFGRRRRG
jgi:hypothetical protein